MADVARGGRAKILLTGMLFFGAYFLARNTLAQSRILQPMSKVRRLLALGVVLAILLIAVEFVRGYRGVYERFYGTSTQLSKLERSAFVTPSIYLYFSSQVGVFNAYWKAGGENPFPGSNTFAPLFRILAKLGIADDVPYFQKFYNVPIYTNTGTYLRELHADFGVVGIIAAPYLLGFFCTYFWFRVKRQSKFVSIALLTHLYMIVLCSFLFQVTRLGEWVVSLIASLVICYFIDRQGYIEEPGKNNDPT
jgi:oligosaccharide repeat unit polymerase